MYPESHLYLNQKAAELALRSIQRLPFFRTGQRRAARPVINPKTASANRNAPKHVLRGVVF